MGGLRRFLPRTYLAFLVGALALTGIPHFPGSSPRTRSSPPALADRLVRAGAVRGGIAGAFLTGLYTFRMVFLVFGGEPSAYAREHFHRPERTEPWLWMGLTVGALTIGRVAAGWIQIAGLWTLVSDFLDPVGGPSPSSSRAERRTCSRASLALSLGIMGVAVGAASTCTPAVAVPQAWAVRAADARAQVLLRRALRRCLNAGGLLGAEDGERGRALAEFAVPDVRTGLEGTRTSSRTTVSRRMTPCPEEDQRVPACRIETAGRAAGLRLLRPAARDLVLVHGRRRLPRGAGRVRRGGPALLGPR